MKEKYHILEHGLWGLMSWKESQPYRVHMVQVLVLSDKWLPRYGLLENFDAEITNWKKTQKNNIDLFHSIS